MPIDWKWATHRYLDIVQPSCILITETEIWLNFAEYCYYKGIKNTIINARLSKRSLDTPYIVRRWLTQALQYTYSILTRSEEDRNNYLKMRTDNEKLKTIGNIKYYFPESNLTKAVGLDFPYILIASSRDGEERLICEKLFKYKSLPLLVIVPRHINRVAKILNDLKSITTDISIRSDNQAIKENTRIYIADTFGELDQFIAGSNFVIMGGSFKPFGGQNIIEVASAKKAVIFGPYMENFSVEAKLFIENNAGIQVNSIEELLPTVMKLADDTNVTKTMGNNGYALVQQYTDIVEQYYLNIVRRCSKLNN